VIKDLLLGNKKNTTRIRISIHKMFKKVKKKESKKRLEKEKK